ncbi:MAG TPA: transporter substrate-binding domain-containing protein, partial [Methylothermaceae bacterium]|nr:transporter substrate-binding domain-containing protein [Methylothermaceae bacterium]
MPQPIKPSSPTGHRQLVSCWTYALMLALLLHFVPATPAFTLPPEQQVWPPMEHLDPEGGPRGIGVRKNRPIRLDILQQVPDDAEPAAIMALDQPDDAGHGKRRDFLRSLSPADRQWLVEHSPVKVGVMDAWPPFSYLDDHGELAGVSIGYLQALSDRLGDLLTPVPGEWKRLYDDVANRRLDVMMDITPKPSRDPLFNFTTPYLDIPHVIVTRKGTPFIASEAELTGKTLALERGFGNVEYFQRHFPDIPLTLYANTLSALEAVSRGDADAYAGNRAVALYLIDRHFLTNLRIHGTLNKPGSILALGVRKDWPKLRDILQQALDDIPATERQHLLKRWIPGVGDQEPTIKLTAAQYDWLDRHPEIPVGIDGNWPPIDFLDKQGRHAGITADYLHLLERRLGIRFNPKKFGSFKEMLEQVMDGDPPVGATVAYNAQRGKRLLYTAPFFDAHEVIVVREENQSLHRIEDLKGHTVAMEDGFITTTKLMNNYPDIGRILVGDTLSALQKVSWGEADAYIGNQAVATWLIRNHQLDNLVVTGDAGFGVDPQHFVVSRLAPDWKPLVGIIDAALATISEAERLQIEERWLGRSPVSELPPVKLTREERRWLQAHKKIRLGIDRAWPPMEFIDDKGEYRGISHDFMRLIGRQLEIKWVKPKAMPWEEVLKGIREKTLDVIPLMAPNRERKTYMNFTRPLVNAQVVIINRRGEVGVDDLTDLNGQRVAVVRGYSVTFDLQRDYPEIVPDLYDNVGEALHAVSAGRNTAFVGILPVAGY